MNELPTLAKSRNKPKVPNKPGTAQVDAIYKAQQILRTLGEILTMY